MNLGVILLALAALVVGGLIGWLARSAGAAALGAKLATAEERAAVATALRQSLDKVTGERDQALRGLAAERAASAAREHAAEARLTELRQAKEALSAQFSEIGGKLLGEAQRQFLERADQRFTQADEKSGERLKALLAPVNERLLRYEQGVEKVEKERREAHSGLTSLIDQMRLGQEAVRAEAAKLVNTFRSAPKARGRWGEQQLKNVLETCGLTEHCDFQTEVSVVVEEGRLRPDVIISVPGGRQLVIDAKVSLNAYQDAFAGVDETERVRGLAAHAAAMRAHVNSLGNKAYWTQFADAPDYVIMFVPGEHFLSAALEQDPTLWDFAFDKRVLLATPTNLIAIARTVAAVWRQEKLANEAKRIAKLGREMHERLSVAATHLKAVGGGLSNAVNNYNKFVNSFETRLVVTGREFEKLNVETGGKEIPELSPVEALPRYGGDGPLPVIAQAAE